MKAKHISDLAQAIATDANVIQNTNERHTHANAQSAVPTSNGAGNFIDSTMKSDGITAALAAAALDSGIALNMETAIKIAMKIQTLKVDGDAIGLRLYSTGSGNTGKNIALDLLSDKSLNENIALRIIKGKMLVGSQTGDDSAIAQFDSPNKGIVFPRMPTSQMNLIATPMNGLLIFNTDDNDLMINIGDGVTPNWVGLKAVGVTGNGTVGKLSRFTGGTTLGDSIIQDDGTKIGFGTSPTVGTFIRALTSDLIAFAAETASSGLDAIGMKGLSNGASQKGTGVFGQSINSAKNVGIKGTAGVVDDNPDFEFIGSFGDATTTEPTKKAVGVYGRAIGNGANRNIGVFGEADDGAKNFAGVFNGKVFVGKELNEFELMDPSASFQINSNNSGLLVPRMSTGNKNGIFEPAKSLIIFDTTINDLQINIGTPLAPIWAGTGAGGISGTFTPNSVPRATNSNTLADGTINDNGTTVAIGSTPSATEKLKVIISSGSPQLTAISGVNNSTTADPSIGLSGKADGVKLHYNMGVYGVARNSTTENIGVAGFANAETYAVLIAKHVGGTFVADSNGTNEDSVGMIAQAIGDSTANNLGFAVYVRNLGTGNAIIGRIDDGNDNTGKFMKVVNAAGDIEMETLTVKNEYLDTEFKLKNNIDATKVFEFDLAAIATGQTRKMIVPNRDITLFGAGGSPTVNKMLKWDSVGNATNSTMTDDGMDVQISGDFTGTQIEATTQFKAPTNGSITKVSNDIPFNCNIGMTQKVDLQGMSANGTCTITNPIEGNTYSLIVVQGSGTYDVDFGAGWWVNDFAFDFSTLADNERALVTITRMDSEYYFSAKKLINVV